MGRRTETHLEDLRGGARHDTYLNPVNLFDPGFDAGQVLDVTSTRSEASVMQTMHTAQPASSALGIYHQGVAGGSNQYPYTIEGAKIPYFKSNYVALSVNGTYNTLGQHGLQPNTIKCYGVGDCLIGAEFLTASGGFRDEADEGAHPMDLQIQEDTVVFTGSCATGCTPGSTTVGVNVATGAGTQGEGRYLIDKNPAGTISAGVLTGGAGTNPGPAFESATFSGTSFPVSVFSGDGAGCALAGDGAGAGRGDAADRDRRSAEFLQHEYGRASEEQRRCLPGGPAEWTEPHQLRDGELHGGGRDASAADPEQGSPDGRDGGGGADCAAMGWSRRWIR